MLENFFAGYLQAKMEGDFKGTYTVFSGGDDFFVVGPWDQSIEFARAVREDFSLFCAGNPDMAFSAGIYLAKPYEPISYCAELVEEKLKNSKRKEGKDRITLFDKTIQWEELKRVLAEAKKIIEWLRREPPIVSRSFVNNLRRYGDMAERSSIHDPSQEVKTDLLRFVPLLVYDIKKNLTRETQKAVSSWAEDLIPTVDKPRGGQNLQFLRTIVDYVLTFSRS